MARFLQGTGPIFIDRVACTGSETTLESCTVSTDTGSCSHSDDAGVGCRDECTLEEAPPIKDKVVVALTMCPCTSA